MKRSSAVLFLTIVLAAAAATPVAAGSGTGRYIVLLRDGVSPASAGAAHARAHGLAVGHVYSSAVRGYSAEIPEARVAALRADPAVAAVVPDRPVRIAAQTTPEGLTRVRTAQAAGRGTGQQVAVIDTGVDLDHPDLAGNILGGKNCSTGVSYNDGNGHGTHVAGTIAAIDNGDGVVGVAPEAKLWAVRVLDNSGSGDISDVVCGVDWVDTKSPAKGGTITVANMSLAASGSDDGNCGNTNGDPLHQAVCRLVADGVTVVAAAGNTSEDIQSVTPAAYDEVITVAALADSDGAPCGLGSTTSYGDDDTFASFSNFATTSGDRAHMLAGPGVDVLSTWIDGYAYSSGTSMATPHVAGAVALYLQAQPGSTPSAVRDALKATGEPVDVNLNGECVSGVSHTDPSGDHPENLLAIDAWELAPGAATPGVTRSATFYLNQGFDGTPEIAFTFGRATDLKIDGDWDGDGSSTPGVVRGATWYLNNGFDGTPEIGFTFGRSTDLKVVGDWDGNGTSTPGVVRAGRWYLNNGFDGTPEIAVTFGRSTDAPMVGDWDGDGTTTIGVVRGATWYLNNGFDGAAEIGVTYGRASDLKVAGDWDGDGTSTPGLVRAGRWYLNDGFDGVADRTFVFGRSTDLPLSGDWVV